MKFHEALEPNDRHDRAEDQIDFTPTDWADAAVETLKDETIVIYRIVARDPDDRFVVVSDRIDRSGTSVVWRDRETFDQYFEEHRADFPNITDPEAQLLTLRSFQSKYNPEKITMMARYSSLPKADRDRVVPVQRIGESVEHEIDFSSPGNKPPKKFMTDQQLLEVDPAEFSERWASDRFGALYRGIDYAAPLGESSGIKRWRFDPSVDGMKHPSFVMFAPTKPGLDSTFKSLVERSLAKIFTDQEVPWIQHLVEYSDDPLYAVLDFDVANLVVHHRYEAQRRTAGPEAAPLKESAEHAIDFSVPSDPDVERKYTRAWVTPVLPWFAKEFRKKYETPGWKPRGTGRPVVSKELIVGYPEIPVVRWPAMSITSFAAFRDPEEAIAIMGADANPSHIAVTVPWQKAPVWFVADNIVRSFIRDRAAAKAKPAERSGGPVAESMEPPENEIDFTEPSFDQTIKKEALEYFLRRNDTLEQNVRMEIKPIYPGDPARYVKIHDSTEPNFRYVKLIAWPNMAARTQTVRKLKKLYPDWKGFSQFDPLARGEGKYGPAVQWVMHQAFDLPSPVYNRLAGQQRLDRRGNVTVEPEPLVESRESAEHAIDFAADDPLFDAIRHDPMYPDDIVVLARGPDFRWIGDPRFNFPNGWLVFESFDAIDAVSSRWFPRNKVPFRHLVETSFHNLTRYKFHTSEYPIVKIARLPTSYRPGIARGIERDGGVKIFQNPA